jgi:glycosyltransferase involved in cell wall biosynthesis
MSKIKVAHIVNRLGFGGVSVVAYHLLKALPAERYELFLYCLKKEIVLPEVRESQVEKFQKLGVTVSFPDRDKRKFYVVGDLCRWILRNRFDILHTHSYNPNIYGRLSGVLYKDIKIIGHYHNYYENKWDADNSIIFDQLLAQSSDQLISCSKSVRDHVSEKLGIPPEKIEVILYGSDQNRFKVRYDPVEVKKELNIPRDRNVVGIIGRISEQKAQDDFIKAAKLIKDAVPDTVFLIVGQTDDDLLVNRLKDLAVSLGIDRDIIYTGYISDVPKVYSALDILVVPSRWEGFGLILVEAMASGKPIVATNVGPIPEVVISDETALLVPPSSPPSIASSVISLLNNPGRAREMGQRGVERAKMFSWERAGRQLDLLYKKLLQGSRRC